MPGHRERRGRRAAHRSGLALFAATIALLLLAGAYMWLLGVGAPPKHLATIGGPFTLTEGNGKVVSSRAFRGKYLLVYFGYTSCPDICPTTLAGIAQALRILGPRSGDLQPLFITVDPQRDTPAVVQAYVGKFSPRILGLTGTPPQIDAVERAYRISSIIQPADNGSRDYSVDHTAVLFLMGPDGQYLAPLPAGESGAELARRLGAFLPAAGSSPVR